MSWCQNNAVYQFYSIIDCEIRFSQEKRNMQRKSQKRSQVAREGYGRRLIV